jgi:hypothetical protein
MEWAAQYDIDPNESGFTGRSLKVHEDWIKSLNRDVLEIRGNFSVEERLEQIMKYLQK